MYAAETDNLWRFYGEKPALRGLNIKVEEGEVFGVIGPNGAGKTTLFRILATLLRPSRGSAKVFGRDVVKEPGEVRKMITYLPEDAGIYKHLSGLDFLKMMASLYGVDAVERGALVSGLDDALREKMGGYSKGMRRRILLASCLMVNPRLAILDEPTAGLDVEHAVYVRKIIREYASEGTTFLVSSHNMLEVSYLCDTVALIHRGEIVEQGEPAELLTRYGVQNLEELFVQRMGEQR
ncbi:MAG: ABC transporter ATP-binding protein [Nitrososphaerota archaeon]